MGCCGQGSITLNNQTFNARNDIPTPVAMARPVLYDVECPDGTTVTVDTVTEARNRAMLCGGGFNAHTRTQTKDTQ